MNYNDEIELELDILDDEQADVAADGGDGGELRTGEYG